MSSIPAEAQVTNGRVEHDVGVAGPPPPAATAAALAPVASDAGPLPLLRLWNPQSIKGWVGSLSLHGTLLVALGCWYFAPRTVRPAEFESRIAGSLDGRLDGDQLLGGSNGTAVDQLDAFESPKEMDRLDSRLPTEIESPTLSLTAPSISLDAAAPLVSRKDSRPNRGRRRGDGLEGNLGAGNGEGFGVARFGNGGEVIRGVAVKVGDPQFTLIWDAKSVDIDLHVIEPKGDHLYFGHRNGRQGGELDVDNTWGYGPENIYWLVSPGSRRSPKVKGAGPTGAYRWSVHYYAAHREDRPHVHWQVRIKHAGEVEIVDGWLDSPGEWSQIYGLKVHPPKDLDDGGPEAAKPGGP
jgi:hypothetical protein